MKVSLKSFFLAFFLTILVTPAYSESTIELDAKVREALGNLYKERSAAKELGGKAKGILVFPTVLKGGFVIGGEYGKGALVIDGKIVDYYSTVSATIGLQLGGQARSQFVMFMTADALEKFRNSKGWEAGVDGSIAIAEFGAGEAIDTKTATAPIIGFITDNRGLMYNLTLEGSKITKLNR
ncbi:MAG: BPSL1445 family SYLF domain-containing lipoprotein [Endozoicomonas sp.]